MKFLLTLLAALCLTPHLLASVRILTAKNATPRELYAAEQLREATHDLTTPGNITILLATRDNPLLAHAQLAQFWPGATESFILHRTGNRIYIAGSDASGVLYGALSLCDLLHAQHAIPSTLDIEDHPALKLRGTAIGMQKPEIIYEGAEYDYRYTPQNFPFFYDKAFWTRYLDMLARNRYNTLYLWNGHPFTSLLRLPKYPEAQELPTAQLEQNIAMFHWITHEADRRGIWVLQGFYNIHLSHTFARAHNLPYHLTTPTPLATAYTRYAISEFIREYPHVGLMMTLGEALSPHQGANWLTNAIIPGVKDGLKEIGSTTQPPIVIRAHATDITADLKAANPLYTNIDTMWKWNGESLTWTNIRGPVLDRFKELIANSHITIANIHLLSNLEPFRWGDPDFIRQTVLNFQKIGIQGVHVYPLRYWDWPNTADNPPLNQLDRDWIWFDAWGRYAWNPNRDPQKEHAYWVSRFAQRFGTSQAGEHLLNAYQLSGVCAPELLARIGITEGNREVFSLGLTMPQLIDAKRFGPAQTLWTGDAPPGERLDDYVEEEAHHEPHHGLTPIAVADSAAQSSAQAVTEAEAAAPFVTKDKAEYGRIVNDMRSIHQLMLFYQAKTQAAALVMLYGYDHDAAHLHAAEPLLAQSVEDFRRLTALTNTTYRDAAAMHTSQRRIPVTGGPHTEHWRDLLPVYQKELATFRTRLALLNTTLDKTQPESNANIQPWPQVSFTLPPGTGEEFTLESGIALLGDKYAKATRVAPEITGFKGIRLDLKQHGPVRFTLAQPAQALVGFFKIHGLTGPSNTDAENWNPVLLNAITLDRGAPLDVWAAPLAAGENELDLSQPYVVLGFIAQNQKTQQRVVFTTAATPGQPPNLDWLFE
ncbi:MAG TPA: hypothetical protein VHY48_13630 [Acidobacteriaceae bacterium]|jgi:hypothetical protein|nr:hypothetical protein [Acidobacteriaceae bacterium]